MVKRILRPVVTFFQCLLMATSCGKLLIKDLPNPEDILNIEVLNGSDSRVVSGWYYNDTLFLAVPSYVSDDSLRIHQAVSGRCKVTEPLTSKTVSFVHPDSVYQVEGKQNFVLSIKKKANLPTMYIDTESGSVAYINQDKSHKEGCRLSVIDRNGEVSYDSYGFDCTIKGRGNSTWKEEKKPYLVKLYKRASLLDMNSAKKWVLLANAFDETNLRNKIVYDFTRKFDYVWAPDSRYADVFINGKYCGLYLVTEKVEVDRSRLTIVDCDSVFLFHMTSINQARNETACFTTRYGQWIVMDYPKSNDYTSLSYANEIVQGIEDVILGDVGGKEFMDVIDVDSWAFKYLVDDVFENTDCNFISSYFFVVFKDGRWKCYGGPIWDYDLSIGNNWCNYEPDMFFARRRWKALNEYTPYYDALLKRIEFQNRVIDIYQNEFKPALFDFINEEVPLLEDDISVSSSLNSVIYSRRFTEIQKRRHSSQNKTIESMIMHLQQRIKVLDDCYLNPTERFLISYETNIRSGYYYYKMVPRGSKIGDLHVSNSSLNDEKIFWKEKGREEVFDFNTEIDREYVLDIVN